ncbi:hypothetical protein BELL_1668g00010 [Botrytis elliptica]|uniref:Heterokaryon incompatibility domain-containing protein n=1 Tax=Botrytis elliptica TaxID=278938 RepID=A0A4Z1HT96_9HELO|nr:hypothetical protein EAE99_012409 [Botrytis elliptica]TGO52318.1 hypothetical protein BELL_1668g00010 [Botrytis elliptica]
MSTLQLEAKSSVDDCSAPPENNQHHLDALEHALDSMEDSTPSPETSQTPKLCDYCEPMFSTIENLQLLTSKEGYKHNIKKGIEEAANRGCGLCKFIETIFYSLEIGNSHVTLHARLAEKRIEDRLPLSKSNSMFVKECLLPRLKESAKSTKYPYHGCKIDKLEVKTSGSPSGRLCILADEGSPAGVYIVRQPLVAKDNFERIIPQIKKWLDDCRHHHLKLCRYSTPKLPTRVLRIESETTSLVRLHVSRPDHKDDYIALSYCWGGPQSFTTTNSTLEQNMRGFDIDNLPLTFKDTILIARKLGIRYIWIDALCIIQDSDLDKAREIEAMGDIFKNATVTISATSATSVDGGLFVHGPTPELLEIPFCLPDKSLSKVYISECKYPAESQEPIYRRAWCLQESILSPRLLSFRSTELLWHCQSLKCEPVTKSVYTYSQMMAEVPANIFGRDIAIQLPDALRRGQIWNSIVENFTGRDLTNPEDRLPAISGIAKELALVWNDEHVFGVMRNTIEHHLSWVVAPRYELDTKHDNARIDRVPSWSWVSVDCPVRFRPHVSSFHMKIRCLEIDNTPASGKIVLEAKVLSLEAHSMNSGLEKFLQKNYDIPEDLKAEANTLMLLGEYEDTNEEYHGCNLSFLVLKRLSNGYYQRVGLLDCWLNYARYPFDDWINLIQDWTNLIHDWMRLESLKYLFDAIEMSRITIV